MGQANPSFNPSDSPPELSLEANMPLYFAGFIIFVLTVALTIVALVLPTQFAFIPLLIPLTIIFGLMALARPELALLGIILFVPFEDSAYLRQVIPSVLSPGKTMGAILIGAITFNIFFRGYRFRIMDDPYDFAILALLGMLLVSGVTSRFPGQVLDTADRMIMVFFLYFATKNLIRSRNILNWIMWGVVITATVATVFGINDFFQARQVRIHDIRVGGLNMHPNTYAVMTVFAISIGLYLLKSVPHWGYQLLVLIFVFILSAGTVLSASRGGLLALAAIGVIYIWRQKQRKLLFSLAAVGVILSFPFWPDSVTARFLPTEEETIYSEVAEHSTQRRMSYVTFGLNLIAESPLTGKGYGTFALYYPESEFARYDNPLDSKGLNRVAHNAFLEIAFGTGLIGLAAFLAVWLIAWYGLRQTMKQFPEGSTEWAMAGGLELALIAMALTSLLLSIEFLKYLWITIGLSSALFYMSRQANLKQQAQRDPV